jgi:hypothetical protein
MANKKKPKKKPYLSYELDAGRDADLAAQKAGVHSDVTRAGLTRLWEHCWRKKTDRVTADELGCFFTGCDEKLRRALALMKFIEIDGDARGDRVKGASRLLRISASRSKGGHAAKGNLKRGTAKPDPAPAHAGEPPACVPAAPRLLQPAANSQHPTDPPPNPLASEGAGSERDCRCTRRPCRHELKLAVVPEPPPTPPTPDQQAYAPVLAAVRRRVGSYAHVQLEQLRPELAGGKLVLHAKDPFFGSWVHEHYAQHLFDAAAEVGGPPVELKFVPVLEEATA